MLSGSGIRLGFLKVHETGGLLQLIIYMLSGSGIGLCFFSPEVHKSSAGIKLRLIIHVLSLKQYGTQFFSEVHQSSAGTSDNDNDNEL